MNRKVLNNKIVRLKSYDGIKDKRTGRVYLEVVCKLEDEHYFEEVNLPKE